jgi:hypothetical protein
METSQQTDGRFGIQMAGWANRLTDRQIDGHSDKPDRQAGIYEDIQICKKAKKQLFK